jgi:putative hydrolase of the HAD superfamily
LASGTIKNIIFDLGGVLMHIDPEKTAKTFAILSNSDPVDIMELHLTQSFFMDYEKGLIDDHAFRNHIRTFLKTDISDTDIDEAWSAMLLDFPSKKIEMLKIASRNFRTFLLSNTNNIHSMKFEKVFKDTTGTNIHGYFEKVYYSFEMNTRKPEKDIFLTVLEENNLIPEETLLIDDSLPNIEAAKNLGIQTSHVQINQEIIEIDV